MTSRAISIDTSGLYKHKPHGPAGNKSADTPLLSHLRANIQLRGPISVATYMKEALTNPMHGYYMNKDAFGQKGDFITSPEISQMFGEALGVWCSDLWEKLGRPAMWNLVELGPGRGSLMHDMLRVLKKTPELFGQMTIHMVEVSPYLRQKQAATLGCDPTLLSGDAAKETSSTEDREGSKILKAGAANFAADTRDTKPTAGREETGHWSSPVLTGADGVRVQWHRHFRDVPPGPFLVVAHELFDALPVYHFEYTEKGWLERLVDVDQGEGPHHLRYVLSPGPTYATMALLRQAGVSTEPKPKLKQKAPTASFSYRGGEDDDDDNDDDNRPTDGPKVGDRIEVCAEGMALASQISEKIAREQGRGAALVIDYGQDRTREDTLRAIKNHKIQDVLCEPGLADITADVDFSSLRRTAQQTPSITTYGPKPQGQFLQELGIDARLATLLRSAGDDSAQAKDLIAAYERLVDDEQMGLTYKAMTICSLHNVKQPPVGFPL